MWLGGVCVCEGEGGGGRVEEGGGGGVGRGLGANSNFSKKWVVTTIQHLTNLDTIWYIDTYFVVVLSFSDVLNAESSFSKG